MIRNVFFFFCLLPLFVFAGLPTDGKWRGALQLNDSIDLPFHFSLIGKNFQILNQQDELTSDDVSYQGDSILIRLAVFATEIHLKKDSTIMRGYFVNTTKANPTYIPLTAERKEYITAERKEYIFHPAPATPTVAFTGRYDVYFKNEDAGNEHAVGIFKQSVNYITGTFLTPTGDYRYLEGNVSGDQMFLGAFDGSHVFYFSARKKGDSLVDGKYYSSDTWYDEWTGIKNSEAKLKSPDEYIKYSNDPLSFSFPDPDGNLISLTASFFNKKPVIIQLMGTWCPNCMDETRFLTEWYNSRSGDIEVIALDFERITDRQIIYQAIKRIKKELNVHYPVLYAGTSDKKLAVKVIPQLDRIFAFPTLIFLDRNRRIVTTHSGFSGPATGEEYEKFKRWFYRWVEKLAH
jgi:thiol-disulfide isomerase/thioredoxin